MVNMREHSSPDYSTTVHSSFTEQKSTCSYIPTERSIPEKITTGFYQKPKQCSSSITEEKNVYITLKISNELK